MSAPTDLCADCGHARRFHGLPPVESGRPVLGCRALKFNASEPCPCPAFDEGAPKPEPNHDALTARIADVIRRSGVPDAEQLVRAVEVRTSVTKAERDVVEAAKDWDRRAANGEDFHLKLANLAMALHRLLDLRETAERETCGSTMQTQIEDDPPVGKIASKDVRCTLHRNHDGEHEGELGRWRWT